MIALTRPWHRVSAGYIWQETYPSAFGIAVFVIVIWYGVSIARIVTEYKVELSNVYTAVAGLFAVITGFLATFYGSIQAITDTRLKRIANTGVFARFIRYVKIATKIGFVIAITSIPFVIFAPSTDGKWYSRILVALWWGLCAFGVATFVRVAGLLFFIFEYKPPADEGAG
jgi:hypothetical protein